MRTIDSFRQRVEDMMSEVYALYLARNDPRDSPGTQKPSLS